MYATAPKNRSISLHHDVEGWLRTASKVTGLPVSVLVNKAVRSYAATYGALTDVGTPSLLPVDEVTMHDDA
jgi:hypothetical protein